MKDITLEELLEAGCHFGHQLTRHNPKSRDFIFEARDNIHIIDLGKTKEGLEEAGRFIKSIAASGGTMILVGTKRQARSIVEEELKRAKVENADGLFSVTNRWIGGTLTNFSEVAKNYKKLTDLTANLQSDEEKSKFTKKEVGQWEKSRAKLASFYGGVLAMKDVPAVLFIIDSHLEHLAVSEARAMGVPTVGITDTNSDPYLVDYPIPANDDAVGSIQLITSYIIDAWIEGRKKGAKDAEQEAKKKVEEVEKVEKVEKVEEVKKEKIIKTKEKTAEPKKKVTKKAVS